MVRLKLFVVVGLLSVLIVGLLSACGNAATPATVTKQSPTPTVVPTTTQPTPTAQPTQSATTDQSASACSPTLPTDTVYVTDGQAEVTPQVVIPYSEGGYCELVYIIPSSGKISVGFHGNGVIATQYSVKLDNGKSWISLVFQTGSWLDVASDNGTCENANKLMAQPLAVHVFYPQGSESLQPATLPTLFSGASLTVATDKTFNIPSYPSLGAALCAPPIA